MSDVEPTLDSIASSTGSSNLLRPLLVTLLIAFLVRWLVMQVRHLHRKVTLIDKIPGPKSFSPILGNIPFEVLKYVGSDMEASRDMFTNLLQAVRGYTEVYRNERIFRLWLGWEPLIILWKPETVEQILSHNFLLDKSTQYSLLHTWLGTGLLTSAGHKWRTRRKMLVPAFHFKILYDFVPVFNEQGWIFVDCLRELARSNKSIDIVPVVTACTLDIICETVMGVSIGAQRNRNNDYCKAVYDVGECFIERLMQPAYWPDAIYYRVERGKYFKERLAKLHEFTRKVIRDRKNELLGLNDGGRTFDRARRYIGGSTMANQSEQNEEKKNVFLKANEPEQVNAKKEEEENEEVKGGESENVSTATSTGRKAFMDLLLDLHLNGEQDLNEEDIREEVDTFMFEGHDTTAMALSWILFLLGHHREVQERLWLEVDAFFENLKTDISCDTEDQDRPQLPLDQLKQLKYLECVIKEGLRLCPSVPFIGRKTHEELIMKDYRVPKGTTVYCFLYMLHRDPEQFPQPEEFRPDRFLPENTQGRHPFVFVPFSAGPRNCIGQRFAMSELKTVLALAVRHFRFESVEKQDKILYNMEMVLRPKMPLKMRIYERELNKTPGNSLSLFGTLERRV